MWGSLISSVGILSTKPEISQKRKNSASRQQRQLLPEFPACQLPQWQGDIPKDQFSSVAQSCLTVCDPMDCSTPGLPVHHQLTSTESVMPSKHLILCRPLLLLPSIFPSVRVFSSESSLPIRWPNYWSFSFSISPSNELLRTDFLQDELVGSPCSSRDCQVFCNTTVQKHQLFGTQLSLQSNTHFRTLGITVALIKVTFAGKVTSLLFNMLSRLVIVFLPRNKCLLISQMQSSSAVILEPPTIKSLKRMTLINFPHTV